MISRTQGGKAYIGHYMVIPRTQGGKACKGHCDTRDISLRNVLSVQDLHTHIDNHTTPSTLSHLYASLLLPFPQCFNKNIIHIEDRA